MLKAIHFLGSVVLGTTLAGADWMDDSGYAELLEYLQVDSLPDNTASLEVDIIEAQETSGTYMPEAGTGSFTGASTHFLGHSFQNVPSLSSSANSNEFQSSHANAVGQAFFSVSRSYAPSLSTIYVNEANDFINGLLSSSFDLSGVVANLSWIVDTGGVSDSGNVAAYAAALQRFDYIASTGNTLVAVGLNNGTSNADGSDRLIPELWAPSYNALSVGVVSGNHSIGDTTDVFAAYDATAGRTKPEIVASGAIDGVGGTVTSWATAQVSSLATYLNGSASTLGYSDVSGNTDVQRAIILAGATKEEFISWSNASTDSAETRPLDDTYGAGEINAFNSYRILEAGAPTTTAVGWHGWQRGTVSGDSVSYTFTVPDGVAGASLSTVVCWNREVRRLANNYSYRNLANLGLSLSGGTLTETITCDSSLDNVEHIYATDLGPGTYTLTVNESTNVGADFGIAWRVNLSAEKALSATVSSSALDFTDVIEGVTYEVWQSTDLSTWEYVDSFVPTATTHTWSPSTTTGDEVYYRIKYWE